MIGRWVRVLRGGGGVVTRRWGGVMVKAMVLDYVSPRISGCGGKIMLDAIFQGRGVSERIRKERF